VTESSVVSGEPPTRPKPSRLTLFLIVAPLVVLTIAAYVGDALAPDLVNRSPLLLIILNARSRNLALVTNQLDTLPYYLVGSVRLLISDPLFYLLGWYYGDQAVKWAERNTKTLGSSLRWVERRFKTWGVPLVFAMPNNIICLFAGAARMSPVVFLIANVSGTFVRLYLIRVVGRTFSGPIDWLLELIATYRTPLLVISFAAVFFTLFTERKRGGGELTGLTTLPDEIDQDRPAPGEPSPPPPVHRDDEPSRPHRRIDPDPGG
jgi:membrane protein DedA with SNARE-associated domain